MNSTVFPGTEQTRPGNSLLLSVRSAAGSSEAHLIFRFEEVTSLRRSVYWLAFQKWSFDHLSVAHFVKL